MSLICGTIFYGEEVNRMFTVSNQLHVTYFMRLVINVNANLLNLSIINSLGYCGVKAGRKWTNKREI